MKIRTQDGKQYLEFGEVYVDSQGSSGQAAVYVRNRLNPAPVCIGIYEDMSRAKGVLYEIDLAYQARKKVFYAPSE
ncbi:MAG: hypothetical protein HFG73_06095 [Hungatella sp.]|nr:hypothetical protein [Hungatella sp.]